jgi:RimJ/RimL family protein N-acetyltransferase
MAEKLVRKRSRIRFTFDPERAPWLANPTPHPAGFELRVLSADLVSRTVKFGVRIESRFWASVVDFIQHGLGVCLTQAGEIVSICYAATVVDGLAEIDVATDPEFRGRGLAGITTKRFIQECLDRQLLPTWDCFDYNTGSLKLALKLGFEAGKNYDFYSFNIPARV